MKIELTDMERIKNLNKKVFLTLRSVQVLKTVD